MTSVTNAVGLKQLCTPGTREQVSVVVLYFQVTFLIVDEGKSVSLVYMLRRRCAERKPVIWYDGLKSYIFVNDGVYKMAPDFHFNELKIFVWTLVDSDQARGVSHQSSSGIVLVFLSSTLLLQIMAVGIASLGLWVLPPWL